MSALTAMGDLFAVARLGDCDEARALTILDISREQVRASPKWDPLVAFDEIYAKRLHRHYGWPGSIA